MNQLFYGIFEANEMPRPQYCIQCFDEVIAKKFVLFFDDLLPRLSKVLPPFLAIKKEVTDFVNTLDSSLQGCLGFSYEIQFLGEKYGIRAGASLNDLEDDFIRFFLLHEPKAHKEIRNANELWQKQQYYQFGVAAAVFLHEVTDTKGSTKLHQ